MHDLQHSRPRRWTHRMPPTSTPRLPAISPYWGRFTSVCIAANARAAGTRLAGDLAVRHLVPESADTGSTRSDGRGIDLLDTKGVVVRMSRLRRSSADGPRLPLDTAAGAARRGGIHRGSG
jgi:hypothetical protein